MVKKFDEYRLLILLLEQIENGETNYVHFDENFIEILNKKYPKVTLEEVKSIILKCETHNWIKKQGMGCDCPSSLTERGKGVAISKRKEYSENFGKKINKSIGEYKNIFYIIGFLVALIVAYIKIEG